MENLASGLGVWALVTRSRRAGSGGLYWVSVAFRRSGVVHLTCVVRFSKILGLALRRIPIVLACLFSPRNTPPFWAVSGLKPPVRSLAPPSRNSLSFQHIPQPSLGGLCPKRIPRHSQTEPCSSSRVGFRLLVQGDLGRDSVRSCSRCCVEKEPLPLHHGHLLFNQILSHSRPRLLTPPNPKQSIKQPTICPESHWNLLSFPEHSL